MRRIVLLLLLIVVPATASARLKVVTTIPDFAAIAEGIGKDQVEASSIARGDQDPHYLEPKPSYALLLNRADLLIEVGLELESGWLPVLMTQSRNPKIQPGEPGHLNASEGIPILEIPTGSIDRSMGDVHPSGNPHYWLNPRNGLLIAVAIRNKLILLDPSHASIYKDNYLEFEQRLSDRIASWEKKAQAFRGKKVVTHHKSFSYFVDWTGIRIEGLVEPKPGIPPNPSHLLDLIQLIGREKIPLLITENYYDPRPSQELAARTGAGVVILPTSVGGEPGIKTYEELFDSLIEKLEGHL